MTIDQFFEQDPEAQLEIKNRAHGGLIAYLTGNVWSKNNNAVEFVFNSLSGHGSTLSDVLQDLEIRLNREIAGTLPL